MGIGLNDNALTTLAIVKSDLGITDDTDNSFLRRAINTASDMIEEYCNRVFKSESITDEGHEAVGGVHLIVDRAPLTTLTSVYYDSAEVSSDNYEIHDAAAGMIAYKYGTWNWTPVVMPDISRTPVPGTERNLYKITYTGGYVLPNGATPASVTGSNTSTFDFSGGKVLDLATNEGTASITFEDSDFSTPSAATATEVKAVIDADIATYDYGFACSIVSGAIKITGGDSTRNWLQISTSTAATVLGLDTTKVYGDRTLPYDLEQACVSIVSAMDNRRGDDTSIKSEKLMSYSVGYGGSSSSGGAEDSFLSSSVTRVLDKYCRVVIL